MNNFHIGNAWQPKNGVAANILGSVIVSILVSCIFLLSMKVFGQEPTSVLAPPAAPVAAVEADGGFDAMSLVLQILPLFLATLSPFMTQGLRAMMKTAASAVNPKTWGAVTMVLGTVVPALAAAVADTSMSTAAVGGAAISGVSWGLKQGAPVVPKDAAPASGSK